MDIANSRVEVSKENYDKLAKVVKWLNTLDEMPEELKIELVEWQYDSILCFASEITQLDVVSIRGDDCGIFVSVYHCEDGEEEQITEFRVYYEWW